MTNLQVHLVQLSPFLTRRIALPDAQKDPLLPQEHVESGQIAPIHEVGAAQGVHEGVRVRSAV
jgi:hypothetical protein